MLWYISCLYTVHTYIHVHIAVSLLEYCHTPYYICTLQYAVAVVHVVHVRVCESTPLQIMHCSPGDSFGDLQMAPPPTLGDDSRKGMLSMLERGLIPVSLLD